VLWTCFRERTDRGDSRRLQRLWLKLLALPMGVAGGVVGAVIATAILLTLVGNIGPFRHKSKPVDSSTNYDPYHDPTDT
jgi:hypothetical protein